MFTVSWVWLFLAQKRYPMLPKHYRTEKKKKNGN